MQMSDIPPLLQTAITSTHASIVLQILSAPYSLSRSKEAHANGISNESSGRETTIFPYPPDTSTLICAGENKTGQEEQGIITFSLHFPSEDSTTNVQVRENILQGEHIPTKSDKSITVSPPSASQNIVSTELTLQLETILFKLNQQEQHLKHFLLLLLSPKL